MKGVFLASMTQKPKKSKKQAVQRGKNKQEKINRKEKKKRGRDSQSKREQGKLEKTETKKRKKECKVVFSESCKATLKRD